MKNAYLGYVLFVFAIIITMGSLPTVSAEHFLLKFGSEGSGTGQFGGISGIVVDSSGNIFVGDGENSRIQKFDSNGKFLLQWGVVNPPGDNYGGVGVQIGAMGTDPNDNIYVGTGVNDSIIQIFFPNGKFISEWDDAFDGAVGFEGMIHSFSGSVELLWHLF